nr:MAG TPA: hypothetical protein [Caudoviricetes sp.]
MYFGKKNITKNLAVSEEVANIALPKSRCHTENTYFCRNTANFLSGVISFDDGTLASFREGFASFVTYITKLSDQCQSPLKVELRRKASRLPYSLRNRLHLLISYQSHSLSKKLANLFAEFKTLCIFVSANILKSVSDTVLYFIAKSRSAVSVSIQYVCQNTKGLRFFCVHTLTNFCSEQWQTWTKVSARRTVRPLRLVPTVRNHSNSLPKSNLSSYWRVTLPNLSHPRAFTAVPYRLLASGATTSSKAAMPQCTNSLLNSKLFNLSIVSDNRPFISVPA